jgi:hypothetical protein
MKTISLNRFITYSASPNATFELFMGVSLPSFDASPRCTFSSFLLYSCQTWHSRCYGCQKRGEKRKKEGKRTTSFVFKCWSILSVVLQASPCASYKVHHSRGLSLEIFSYVWDRFKKKNSNNQFLLNDEKHLLIEIVYREIPRSKRSDEEHQRYVTGKVVN